VAEELAVSLPETLLAVRMALDCTAMLKEVGETASAFDATTLTATLTLERLSRIDTVVLPAPWPKTVRVAPELVIAESVTVATPVLPDWA
jgi:hypothetical protein